MISLGGSIIVPREIDAEFLKGFKKLILKHLRRFKKIIIVTGGGYTSRKYRDAADAISQITRDDMDWLGIHSSRLNGHLMRTIFRDQAHPVMVTTPDKKINFKEKILIAAGWRPGWSTDYVATVLARTYDVETIINLSNIEYVFDHDPRKFKQAKPLKEVGWPDFRKMVGNKWTPSGNYPFDPVASKLAQNLGIVVYVMNGRNLKNLDHLLMGREFKGTKIA